MIVISENKVYPDCIEETMEEALGELIHYYRTNSLRANPDNSSTELRGKKIIKDSVEQYRLREHCLSKILWCHPRQDFKLQGAHTEGGHTQQPPAETKIQYGTNASTIITTGLV